MDLIVTGQLSPCHVLHFSEGPASKTDRDIEVKTYLKIGYDRIFKSHWCAYRIEQAALSGPKVAVVFFFGPSRKSLQCNLKVAASFITTELAVISCKSRGTGSGFQLTGHGVF
jgi:hypothetical protein